MEELLSWGRAAHPRDAQEGPPCPQPWEVGGLCPEATQPGAALTPVHILAPLTPQIWCRGQSTASGFQP